MKKVQKTVFISADGREFISEKECIEWENRKFQKSIINLTNDEILRLLNVIHTLDDTPYFEEIEKIEIRKENIDGCGLEYKITKHDTFNGKCQLGAVITGENDFIVFPVA